MKPNKISVTLIPNQTGPGRIPIPKGRSENHPPKKQMAVKALIIIIFEYSPKKKSAKPIALYSVK